MKKCPYCSEEIQNQAIVCKHCRRQIGSRWPRRIITVFICLAVAAFAFKEKKEIKRISQQMQPVLSELKNVLSDLGKGIDTIKEEADNHKKDSRLSDKVSISH